MPISARPEHDQPSVGPVVFGVSDPEQRLDAAPLMALISLPRTRPAVADARRWLTDTLTAWGVTGDQLDDAVLALSEVVTNAVVHAIGTGNATVTAALWHGHLRITVSDPDPEVYAATGDDEGGRGLLVVRAVTMRHGVTRTATGKVAWFEMTAGCAACGCDCGTGPACSCTCCCSYEPAVAVTTASIGGAR